MDDQELARLTNSIKLDMLGIQGIKGSRAHSGVTAGSSIGAIV